MKAETSLLRANRSKRAEGSISARITAQRMPVAGGYQPLVILAIDRMSTVTWHQPIVYHNGADVARRLPDNYPPDIYPPDIYPAGHPPPGY